MTSLFFNIEKHEIPETNRPTIVIPHYFEHELHLSNELKSVNYSGDSRDSCSKKSLRKILEFLVFFDVFFNIFAPEIKPFYNLKI